MAHTVVVRKRLSVGNEFGVLAKVTISSYTSGGELLVAGDYGLGSIDRADPIQSPGGRLVAWDYDNKKLMVYEQDAGGAMAESSGDLSSTPLDVVVYGRP